MVALINFRAAIVVTLRSLLNQVVESTSPVGKRQPRINHLGSKIHPFLCSLCILSVAHVVLLIQDGPPARAAVRKLAVSQNSAQIMEELPDC